MFVSFEEEENWKQRIYIDIFDILFSNFLTFNLWVEISCSVSKFQIYKKNSLSTLIARTDNSLSHPSSVKPFRPTRGTRGMFVRHWRFARSHETFAPRQKLRTVNEEPRHAPIEPTASSLFLPLCSSPNVSLTLTRVNLMGVNRSTCLLPRPRKASSAISTSTILPAFDPPSPLATFQHRFSTKTFRLEKGRKIPIRRDLNWKERLEMAKNYSRERKLL